MPLDDVTVESGCMHFLPGSQKLDMLEVDPEELSENQGACTNLDEATCTANAGCQQVYEDSGHQPRPFATQCVLVEERLPPTAACETLTFDGCRTRSDCSLIYWQDLGPDDGPVGDPYYKSCVTEGTIGE